MSLLKKNVVGPLVTAPRDCLWFFDDPDYVEDVTKDPVGFGMFWIYFDHSGAWHGGRCVNERQAKQLATRYGYRQTRELPC